jgi:hypothetical protein
MTTYRSLVPGGFFSSPADTGKVPASIWSNNPGAINGNAQWVQDSPGFVKTVVIGGGNPIAVFETPEQGVALWFNLMKRYQAGGYKTLQEIINHYGGGQDYSEYVKFVAQQTGFPTSQVIDLNNDKDLTKFFKAMIRFEAGRPSPLYDSQIAYGFALGRGEQPAVAQPSSQPAPQKAAVGLLQAFFNWFRPRSAPSQKSEPAAPQTAPEGDFAAKILATMRKKGYTVDEGEDVVNIVYVPGVNEDGTPNQNRVDAFDDGRFVLKVVDGVPKLVGAWQSTIETGVYYTQHPIAEDGQGAAMIAFDQFKAWQVGLHRGKYEALIQTGGPVTVYRDNKKDFKRGGAPVTTGYFGINQHHGYDAPRDAIGYNSAGCLVGRMVKGHEEFMALVKSDKRYQENHQFVFSTAILDRKDVLGE